MSRICVKGLPTNSTEEELRSLFSQKGEVTDVKIIRTKSGVSRKFGFIGFRTDDEANQAAKYFNQSYLHTSKITVELAVRFEDTKNSDQLAPDSLIRLLNSKSKHTKKKLNEVLQNQTKTKENKPDVSRKTAKFSKSKNMRHSTDNTELMQFKELMKNRRVAKISLSDGMITNDPIDNNKYSPQSDDSDSDEYTATITKSNDVDSIGKQETTENHQNKDDDNDNDSITTSLSAESVSVDTKPSRTSKMSDMEYLRSKVKKSFSDLDMNTNQPAETIDDSSNKKKSKLVIRDENTEIISPEETSRTDNAQDTDDSNIDDTGRLFVRNLPFSANEDDLKVLFESYGPVSEVHIPLNEEHKSKGFAFIQFLFPEHSIKALKELDGSSFQGRLLHIIQAKAPKEQSAITANMFGKKLSSYQLKNEEARRKQLNKKDGWNASYIRTDAMMESLAERYGMKASDIMDTSQSAGELAVRVAYGETQIIQENRSYLSSYGVNIESLESTHSASKSNRRSHTTLLIKNLPYDMIPDELEQLFSHHGRISSFLIPPSKTLAVIDFIEPSEARAAYKALAYRSYHKQPLYLEWAPIDMLDREKASNLWKSSQNNRTITDKPLKDENQSRLDVDENINEFSTLFIKNLNFRTTEDTLKEYAINRLKLKGIRAISIKMKSSDQSLGYGFIEFQNKDYAMIGLSKLQHLVIDDHAIEVKPSEKRLTIVPTENLLVTSKKLNTKIVVRNVPFQATNQELKSLFSSFGLIKTIRIPKKMNGNHRGFAFIEFTTHQEAITAITALKNTHLYGRHLVIEWAKEDEEINDVNVLRKRMMEQEKVIVNNNKKMKLNDINEDGFEGLLNNGVNIRDRNHNSDDDGDYDD